MDKAYTIRTSRSKSGKSHKKSSSIPLPEEQPGTSKQSSARGKECRDKTKTSKASEHDERRRDRVLQKICTQSASRSATSPPMQGVESSSTRQLPTAPSPGPSGVHLFLDNPDLAIVNTEIWGTAGAIPPTGPSSSVPITGAEDSNLPSGAGVPSSIDAASMEPANIQSMIAQAIWQGIAVGLKQFSRPSSVVSEISRGSMWGPEQAGPSSRLQMPEHYSTTSSIGSHSHLSDEDDCRGLDLSDDEGLMPGLFQLGLFKSLLFKTKNSACLGTPSSTVADSSSGPTDPLFAEHLSEAEVIPSPQIFIDTVQRQWSFPASGPIPSAADRRYFNMESQLAHILQIPSMDPPVAALHSPTIMPGDPEELLKPEDKRTE